MKLGQQRPPRRPLRSALRTAAVALVVLVALGGAGLLVWHNLAPDREAWQIDAERARRLAYAGAGQPLPGTPDLANLTSRLAAADVTLGAPVFIRIFKREFELELWLRRRDRFERFAVYPICRWSGDLGPKLAEGDGQTPEGFYSVDAKALNPNSRWHRSFNLGVPNAFDKAHARTGSLIMVHGGCASIGCFAMTDPVVDEIWRLVTAALNGGQARFHVHVFPFRMTEENLAQRSASRWAPFWQELKLGHDAFESVRLPPRIAVCNGRYTVTPIEASRGVGHEIANSCINLTGNRE